MKKYVNTDSMEVFKKLKIPTDSSKKIGTWQVHPIDRGTKLFTQTHGK